jgi:hypothetical protein
MRFPLTLLHLTDLHFTTAESKGHYWNSESTELELAPHDRHGLLGSLLSDLADLNARPDLVLVSGDLVDRGSEAGVPLVLEFLNGLMDGLVLHRTRAAFVPGNHDVLRDLRMRYALWEQLWGAFYGSVRPRPDPSRPAHERVHLFDYPELGIQVLGFNSCEALATDHEYGSIGQAQRDFAERLLAPSASRAHFRVALMHHHLSRPQGIVRHDYSVMDDAAAIRSWLSRQRFQLTLHGHQHADWQEVHLIDNWHLAIAAGASLGVGSYGRMIWELRLGYQVILIESWTCGLRIRREYDPRLRTWTAAGGGEPRQVLSFGSRSAALRSTPGRLPTRTSLRQLLAVAAPTDDDLEAFAGDELPNVQRQFSSGMSRTRKENILLDRSSTDEILAALSNWRPEVVVRNQHLLEYEDAIPGRHKR